MEPNVAELPLSHRALAWVDKNRNQALLGVAGVILAGLTVWLFICRAEDKQNQASSELSNVATTQLMNSGAGQGGPQAYLKIAADHPGSKAAARALLLAGAGFFAENKYSEAQAQFERFTREHRDNPLLGEALIGIASCLEAQGKTDQAITAYRDLITRHPADSVLPQAKFSLAGLYETQKKPELARDFYEQVERESRYSILASEAGMRLEELAQKNPNLAPAVMSSAPSAAPAVPLPTATNAPAPQPKP
jgi:TolA-binding protein